jgi:hypothetical protein
MFSVIESSFSRLVRRKTVEGASRKEYLEEEESLQRHVGNRGSKSLKCIVKSIAYANTTSEAGRFCGCGRKRREGYGFAEVSELCPGIVKN